MSEDDKLFIDIFRSATSLFQEIHLKWEAEVGTKVKSQLLKVLVSEPIH